jgi:ribosomal protein S25
MKDMAKKGRSAAGGRNGSRTKPKSRPRGEAHRKSILTEDQVRKIREEYALGGITQQGLADKYGVSVASVNGIVTKRAWIHVK